MHRNTNYREGLLFYALHGGRWFCEIVKDRTNAPCSICFQVSHLVYSWHFGVRSLHLSWLLHLASRTDQAVALVLLPVVAHVLSHMLCMAWKRLSVVLSAPNICQCICPLWLSCLASWM